MTNSSFYHDGFRDATKGEKPSPPNKHLGTNVFADEYMAGYNDGMEERELESRYEDTWPTEYRAWKSAQQPHAVDASPVVGGENSGESSGSRH